MGNVARASTSGEPAAAAEHDEGREGHGDGEQNRCGDGCETEREGEGLPVHGGPSSPASARIGEFRLNGGREQEVEKLMGWRRAVWCC